MSKKVVMFEFEKETKNSVRYKEVPGAGTAPIVGTLYVQKWFAGDSKSIEITIAKKTSWLAITLGAGHSFR
ncbi:hypothetical protein [Marinobacter sp. BSs20148]|uniref:hypothetical protein n=1 Tax=Marinobacter sp. BSs20148 TaxID=490759 RepID=UPI0005A28737|nr:hypothetical protein [Marinobacter sp. BSs20148]